MQVGAYISCAGPFEPANFRAEIANEAQRFAPATKTFKLSLNEFEEFKQTNFPKYSLFCNDDTFFEQSNLERYSKLIGSKPILIKNKQHFNNIDKLDELENLIEKVIKE